MRTALSTTATSRRPSQRPASWPTSDSRRLRNSAYSSAIGSLRGSAEAVRWVGRYCREVDAGLEEAQAVLAALAALRTHGGSKPHMPSLT
jgi:hypothetical protein